MPLIAILIMVALLLFAAEYAYVRFARSHGLVEHKSQRSSHTAPNVVLGGGFIFPLAILLSFLSGFCSLWVLGAVVLVAAVSMTDDLHPLPDWLRLLVQIGAMLMVCVHFGFVSPWMWLAAVLCHLWSISSGIRGSDRFAVRQLLLYPPQHRQPM